MNKFISHRGNNSDTCENNLECLKNVLNYNYISGIEIDIRQTKDLKLVLSHNSFVRKNFNFYFISKTTLKNLKQNTYIIKGKDFKINTLKELLSTINTNKIILLDIKYRINIHKFYNIIKKYKHLNIYICSFNYDLVLKVKKTYPHLKVGLIIGYKMNENKDITPFDFISVHYNSVDKYKKEHFIWTINNINHLNNINDNLGIITDNSYILNKKETNNSF